MSRNIRQRLERLEQFTSEPQAREHSRQRIALLLPGQDEPIILSRRDAGLLRSRIHAVLTALRIAEK